MPMTLNPARHLIALGAAALLTGAAFAQPSPFAAAQGQSASQSSSQAPMPAERSDGALRYQCGGIGSDESTAMRAAMKNYPLSLLFARADGAYEANIDVRITPQGGSGQAMNFKAGGPVCLLKLPAGSYQVHVQGAGQSHDRNVKVGGAPQSLDFRF